MSNNTFTPDSKVTHDEAFISEMILDGANRNAPVWVVFYFPSPKAHGIFRGILGYSFTDRSIYLVRSEDGLSEIRFQISDVRSLCGNTIFLR